MEEDSIVIKGIILITVSLFLSVLSGDMLYLYYAGGWTDSNTLVRNAELLLLYLLTLAGVGIAIWEVIELRRGQ